MALSTARMHRVRGRPPLLAAGINSLIHSHSSSVRSLGYIFSLIYLFYTTPEDFSDRLLGEIGQALKTGHVGGLYTALEAAITYLACHAQRAHPKRDRATGRSQVGLEPLFGSDDAIELAEAA